MSNQEYQRRVDFHRSYIKCEGELIAEFRTTMDNSSEGAMFFHMFTDYRISDTPERYAITFSRSASFDLIKSVFDRIESEEFGKLEVHIPAVEIKHRKPRSGTLTLAGIQGRAH